MAEDFVIEDDSSSDEPISQISDRSVGSRRSRNSRREPPSSVEQLQEEFLASVDEASQSLSDDSVEEQEEAEAERSEDWGEQLQLNPPRREAARPAPSRFTVHPEDIRIICSTMLRQELEQSISSDDLCVHLLTLLSKSRPNGDPGVLPYVQQIVNMFKSGDLKSMEIFHHQQFRVAMRDMWLESRLQDGDDPDIAQGSAMTSEELAGLQNKLRATQPDLLDTHILAYSGPATGSTGVELIDYIRSCLRFLTRFHQIAREHLAGIPSSHLNAVRSLNRFLVQARTAFFGMDWAPDIFRTFDSRELLTQLDLLPRLAHLGFDADANLEAAAADPLLAAEAERQRTPAPAVLFQYACSLARSILLFTIPKFLGHQLFRDGARQRLLDASVRLRANIVIEDPDDLFVLLKIPNGFDPVTFYNFVSAESTTAAVFGPLLASLQTRRYQDGFLDISSEIWPSAATPDFMLHHLMATRILPPPAVNRTQQSMIPNLAIPFTAADGTQKHRLVLPSSIAFLVTVAYELDRQIEEGKQTALEHMEQSKQALLDAIASSSASSSTSSASQLPDDQARIYADAYLLPEELNSQYRFAVSGAYTLRDISKPDAARITPAEISHVRLSIQNIVTSIWTPVISILQALGSLSISPTISRSVSRGPGLIRGLGKMRLPTTLELGIGSYQSSLAELTAINTVCDAVTRAEKFTEYLAQFFDFYGPAVIQLQFMASALHHLLTEITLTTDELYRDSDFPVDDAGPFWAVHQNLNGVWGKFAPQIRFLTADCQKLERALQETRISLLLLLSQVQTGKKPADVLDLGGRFTECTAQLSQYIHSLDSRKQEPVPEPSWLVRAWRFLTRAEEKPSGPVNIEAIQTQQMEAQFQRDLKEFKQNRAKRRKMNPPKPANRGGPFDYKRLLTMSLRTPEQLKRLPASLLEAVFSRRSIWDAVKTVAVLTATVASIYSGELITTRTYGSGALFTGHPVTSGNTTEYYTTETAIGQFMLNYWLSAALAELGSHWGRICEDRMLRHVNNGEALATAPTFMVATGLQLAAAAHMNTVTAVQVGLLAGVNMNAEAGLFAAAAIMVPLTIFGSQMATLYEESMSGGRNTRMGGRPYSRYLAQKNWILPISEVAAIGVTTYDWTNALRTLRWQFTRRALVASRVADKSVWEQMYNLFYAIVYKLKIPNAAEALGFPFPVPTSAVLALMEGSGTPLAMIPKAVSALAAPFVATEILIRTILLKIGGSAANFIVQSIADRNKKNSSDQPRVRADFMYGRPPRYSVATNDLDRDLSVLAAAERRANRPAGRTDEDEAAEEVELMNNAEGWSWSWFIAFLFTWQARIQFLLVYGLVQNL